MHFQSDGHSIPREVAPSTPLVGGLETPPHGEGSPWPPPALRRRKLGRIAFHPDRVESSARSSERSRQPAALPLFEAHQRPDPFLDVKLPHQQILQLLDHSLGRDVDPANLPGETGLPALGEIEPQVSGGGVSSRLSDEFVRFHLGESKGKGGYPGRAQQVGEPCGKRPGKRSLRYPGNLVADIEIEIGRDEHR
jgi:hypothetical protein